MWIGVSGSMMHLLLPLLVMCLAMYVVEFRCPADVPPGT